MYMQWFTTSVSNYMYNMPHVNCTLYMHVQYMYSILFKETRRKLMYHTYFLIVVHVYVCHAYIYMYQILTGTGS